MSITAMKAALSALEEQGRIAVAQYRNYDIDDECDSMDDDSVLRIANNKVRLAITALRNAIQEAEAKATWNRNIRDSVDSLLAQAGYAEDSSARHQLGMMNFDAPPPAQPAKPLTDQEIDELADRCTPDTETGSLNYLRFARAIEAKIEGEA